MNLLKLTAFFVASLMKKNVFSSSSHQNLLADRKAVDSTQEYSLLAGDTNQAPIFSLHTIRRSKQHRLIN